MNTGDLQRIGRPPIWEPQGSPTESDVRTNSISLLMAIIELPIAVLFRPGHIHSISNNQFYNYT